MKRFHTPMPTLKDAIAEALGRAPRPRRRLALCFIPALLSSCALIERPEEPEAQAAVPTGAIQREALEPAEPSPAAIPVLLTNVSSEQQELIDEINRDGQPFTYQGFDEELPEVEPIESQDVVQLDYEQADLRLVLEELADALDITLVIDPTINTQISMRTSEDRPLLREDIWPLVRMLTRDNGIILERSGDVYNARLVQSNLPVDITTPDNLGDGASAFVMQVTPLTYVSTESVAQVLQPLLEPEGQVRTLGSNDVLLLSGTEFQLERANELISLLDTDPFRTQGIQLYQLSSANATELATELTEILQIIEGPNPAFQVKGIERINALLVTAPATRGFDEVSRWVRILDADSQDQVEQLFMYRVKNLVATELAQTLSTVFEIEEELIPETALAREPNPANFLEAAPDSLEVPEELSVTPPTVGDSSPTAVSADLAVTIVADEATNSLLIRSTARDYRQLLTTISQLDVVPLQVVVNAVIAQITLNDDTRFGVDWSRVAANADLQPISTTTLTEFTPDLGGLMFTKNFLDGAARVEATLEAIATNNEVRLLARPSLTVSNNQEGEIQIGAEVPVEAGQSIGQGGVTTSSIQYRPTGIELYITPQINSDGVVNLVIRQVLSSVDNAAGGVNGNPVFNNQEISTTVVVRNGENIVLGGLIQNDNQDLSTGVPFLNQIPVLGALFSYQQFRNERRELFIVLRPEVINLNEEGTLTYSEVAARFELASELFEEFELDY